MKNNSLNKKLFTKNILDTLLQAYRPFLFKLIFAIILGFIGRILLISNAQVVGQFYDTYKVWNEDTLTLLIQKLALILTSAYLLTLFYRVFFSRLSAQAVSRIYDETTYRVSRYPLSFFDQNPVGKITTRFASDYGNVFRLFGGPLAEFLSIIFDLTAIALMVIFIHPYFLVSIFFAVMFFYFIFKFNQYKLRELRRSASELRGPSVAHFSETVQGYLTIRQNSKAPSFLKKFFELDLIFTQSKIAIVKQISKFTLELNLLSGCLFFINGFIGYQLVKLGQLGVGQVTVVLGYTVLATQTLQMFFEWFTQFEDAIIGIERLDEFLRNPIEEGAFLPKQSDFQTSHPRLTEFSKTSLKDQSKIASESEVSSSNRSMIKVSDLTLIYPGQTNPTLSQISFEIAEGEKVGIIGRTGAGKSSLIAALLKLYPLAKGAIFIKNEIQKNVETHRQYFSMISQDQLFLKGTMRDNLDLFQQKSDKQIFNVLKNVGLNYALDYGVEEKGQNLSQGEKQLLSLARGLLQDSEIFIFDEATANIDPQSETLIENALKVTLARKTQIRIAHRLQTVFDCDRIIWLENGSIKMIGSAAEVIKKFESVAT